MSTSTPEASSADLSSLAEEAVRLAAEILNASRENETTDERTRSAMMARMMSDEAGKKFTIAMADQVLRYNNPARAANRMASLIDEFGVPRFFGGMDRFVLSVGTKLAGLMPSLVMPKVKAKVRADSAHVIVSAEEQEFAKYLQERKQQKIRVNFNQLGEAVLGHHEADRRLRDNKQRLIEPGVDYVSIKLSSIVSQISLTGYQQTIESIKPRLREIYRAAIEGGGSSGPKFVNLDMEEYRDLNLTVEIFQQLLDEPEFDKFPAGIVLQAYLPDSFEYLKQLTQWSRARFERTGTDIKIRIVKGANLAMETVEASMEDWEQAPYHSKLEVDANYKRMLQFACQPENAKVVRIGVGSHNLFDIAYAMLLRKKYAVESRIEFEMLEGMANAQAAEVRDRTGDLLFYTPVVLDAEFESAVAYLVRRLDENTEPGSFLGALFALKEGSTEWKMQRDAFLKACQLSTDPTLLSGPNRKQNRLTEIPITRDSDQSFKNTPNTDFSLPANRQWSDQIFDKWRDHTPEPIPISVGGKDSTEKLTGQGSDPSRPGHAAYQFAQADAADIELALSTAVSAQKKWGATPIADRAKILQRLAVEMAKGRGDTIGAMLLDAGKNVTGADVEISEAIDFANYYSRGLDDPGWSDGTQGNPCGVVVVTPPWNFPYAIPAGGVIAALMAGNSVILKPARKSVLTGWQIAQQCWKAGVPKDVLQFAPTVDGKTGRLLIDDDRTAAVILTGGYAAAQLFQGWRPNLRLYAETSGKNAMIVSAAADLDLAVKDMVHGAFGHAGQKCSATSLGLIQAEVYDSPKFMNQLKDAAKSLTLGTSWNPSAIVTPLIGEPNETLMRGLTKLDAGEEWLLEPHVVDDNPCHWSPGIRIGVKPGSWYHKSECFGPVLGLIRVESLEEAIEIQNSNDFGLTGGLHSLDPKEIALWREKVHVGNAYINRTTTGAIVQRQPFGGWKDSCVGPGAKAGGPNYVAAFCDWTETALPKLRRQPVTDVEEVMQAFSDLVVESEREKVVATGESYAHWWFEEFCKQHDPSQLHGETNDFRYRARPWHFLRVQEDAIEQDNLLTTVAQVALACETVGTQLRLSLASQTQWSDNVSRIGNIQVTIETDADLVDRLKKIQLKKNSKNVKSGSMHIIGKYDVHQFAPVEIGNVPIWTSAVLSNGRLELLKYLKEQSVSETVHRYGNII